ncbi:hypothetical protein MKD52_08120 [Helicobacter sp. CaF467b]|uniref:hypothetical protein n=1 Tax=Helicobacter sp. CaF467b TaxID=2919923 RepID=UPI001F571F23|nr:hypothetical protein [Helicobacter sp. CaF467b]MCI2236791.1 hypothetical protein [Helicobacter sp. CaF467b]
MHSYPTPQPSTNTTTSTQLPFHKATCRFMIAVGLSDCYKGSCVEVVVLVDGWGVG